MPLSGRHEDPILEQIARDAYALFPQCYRCGFPIDRFEDADFRVHLHRMVHRGPCPAPPTIETFIPATTPDR